MINNECFNEALASCIAAINGGAGFYPNKDFGMKISAGQAANGKELLAYARQACSGIDGAYVKSAEMTADFALLEILVNGKIGQVRINFE